MVFAHDPQQSMVMTMNDSATAYVSGWNKIGSSDAARQIVDLTADWSSNSVFHFSESPSARYNESFQAQAVAE
jgi:hypothetical protein